jgi:glycosyltransferase involved in cell wall biosynthesis
LAETLESLVRAEFPRDRYELIVVDDGRDASTESIVSRLGDEGWTPRLLHGEGRGAAAARNSGARSARGDFLLFCDDDVVVPSSHLRRHLHVQGTAGPCMCAGYSELDERVQQVMKKSSFGRYWLSLEASYWAAIPPPDDRGLASLELLSGRNLCLPRSKFAELGGFDESFPYAGAEDQDLSMRAAELGLPRLIDHENRVRHMETRLDFSRFCDREERGAHTYAVLARKFPETAGRSELARANDPRGAGEGLGARAKLWIKRVLGVSPSLWLLHGLVRTLELARLPDGVMRQAYAAVIGVHIARGYRAGMLATPRLESA